MNDQINGGAKKGVSMNMQVVLDSLSQQIGGLTVELAVKDAANAALNKRITELESELAAVMKPQNKR